MHVYSSFLAALLDVQKKAGKDPKAQIRVEPIPESIRSLLLTDTGANGTGVQQLYASIPAALRDALMPFQRAGVEFALGKGGRVLIGDEMGLGKTIQAIALCSAFLSDWPVLVVCPSSMRMMWKQELLRWLPGLVTDADVNVVFSGRDRLDRVPVTVISYDLFHKFGAEMAALGCGIVVADEVGAADSREPRGWRAGREGWRVLGCAKR